MVGMTEEEMQRVFVPKRFVLKYVKSTRPVALARGEKECYYRGVRSSFTKKGKKEHYFCEMLYCSLYTEENAIKQKEELAKKGITVEVVESFVSFA